MLCKAIMPVFWLASFLEPHYLYKCLPIVPFCGLMPPRTLLCPIPGHLGAYVGSETGYLEITRGLPQLCKAYTDIVLQSDNDRFISHSFLFIECCKNPLTRSFSS